MKYLLIIVAFTLGRKVGRSERVCSDCFIEKMRIMCRVFATFASAYK